METITFFIELVIAALKKGRFDKKIVSEMLKYNKLMLSQCSFIRSFVQDLLDLQCMTLQRNLQINKERFDPNELFDHLLQIFKPQANAKGVKLIVLNGMTQSNIYQDCKLPPFVGD